ncbi:MAG: glycosyltransferase [Planctomycetes bacterium]|nr:glycosyltransferase [Planctomycetota bacterium]
MILHTRVVTGTGGGPDKTILNSPRFLTPAGYDTLCAYMFPPGDPGFQTLRHTALALDAPLLGIEDRGAWDLRVVGRLIGICRRKRVALWHGHDYKSNALGLLVRRFHRMKLVSTVHGWGVHGGRTPLYYRIDRLCLRFYHRVICVSEDLLGQCLAAKVRPDRCTLIENAVDTNRYARRRTPSEAKAQLGFDPGRLLIGTVGRLSAEKNFAGLIRAVDQLLRQGHDVELAIVGEGDCREELERLIAELDRGDRVRLLGFRADTLDLYQAMDLFVLNSLREGLPNVVLEAMATEVPVVATRVAGVPRLIEDDVDGLLIEPDSDGPLIEALARLIGDAGLRARLAAAARRTVETRYSFARRMEKMRDVYDELLQGRTDG